MTAERYVVLGLAPARSAWFRAVGAWANSGAIPVEFVKCLSAEEVRARLASGRTFSALLADAGLPSLDRDLAAETVAAGGAVLVVDDGRVDRDWSALGVSRLLPHDLGRDDLLNALAAHARLVQRGHASAGDLLNRPPAPGWRGVVVAVTGPGGTGASIAAMALSQSLGDDVRQAGMVLLADLCLNAEQAMLHDVGDVGPGLQELVEAHRGGQPTAEEVRSLVLAAPGRRYHLLLGLRRARHWASLRPRAFEAAFDSLERSFRVVVCDTDADVEGEEDGGSIDVEERNIMARTALGRAHVVFAVGVPSVKGLHALVRVVDGLLTIGIEPAGVVPVLNRAPRSARAKAGFTQAFAELAGALPSAAASSLPTPVFLPERRIDDALRDGTRLPPALGEPLAGAFRALTSPGGAGAGGARVGGGGEPEPVRPGSLGRWTIEAAGP